MQEKENKIRQKIDLLWENHDRDMSGELDKEESREFIKELLESLDMGDVFSD